MVIVNVVLAVFNLLPVPPLDGSRIVDAFVPRRWRPAWDAFSRLGPILLILVIFLPYLAGLGVLDDIEAWVQDLLTRVSR
jgi:Zn-dependent protease